MELDDVVDAMVERSAIMAVAFNAALDRLFPGAQVGHIENLCGDDYTRYLVVKTMFGWSVRVSSTGDETDA